LGGPALSALPLASVAGSVDRTTADAAAPLSGRGVVGVGGVERMAVLAAILDRVAVMH
jgi:hypothetical protein